jgi:hypothetical protein
LIQILVEDDSRYMRASVHGAKQITVTDAVGTSQFLRRQKPSGEPATSPSH